ncbi:hypothetical protein BC941DRAFT_407557 [Chlamydoabsidia padenii]|nr:hypothetical protein BC941DRAFT_407557 [Chlamydoabsidia padenii]
MLNNSQSFKRPKYDNEIAIDKCFYCQGHNNNEKCPHQAPNTQFTNEYQQIRIETEEPAFDLNDIGRRLRKLETRLTLCLRNQDKSSATPASHYNIGEQQPVKIQTRASKPYDDPSTKISLTSTGLNITTHLTESHHFLKLFTSGINPASVQQKAINVFARGIDVVRPTYDNPNNAQGISNLSIDNEGPEESAWLDLVLATSYPMCFLVYQMVEKDRLVEWVSPAFIGGLKGQSKLEHSLLAKSVRAFVYNHEKMSARHYHCRVGGHQGPNLLLGNINPNRGAFFFQQAQELLELCYLSSSRNSIRALLHMYMYQVMTPFGHLNAIQYSDLAIRMAQVLKLGTEKGMLVNEQTREDDRRLWWSTLWVHLSSCVAFHRPVMVSAADIIIPGDRCPSKRQDESDQVGYCIDFCVNSVKLLLISLSIGKTLCSATTETGLLWNIKNIEHQLEAWSLALPQALQPRFWTFLHNDNQALGVMVNGASDGESNPQSTRAFAVEIGLLLQGQWAMTRMLVYECLSTQDSSIFDLLMVRNRLDAALNYTNHLAQSLELARPCLIMYLLTMTEPSLTTLVELAKYENSMDVTEQAMRQLSMLKVLFQADPFSNDITAQTWVRNINDLLSYHSGRRLTYD